MHLRWQIAPAKAQVRAMAASQAWTAPRWTALSIITGSIESTRHPSAKAARISSWVIRRGPNTPGCRSLKHSCEDLVGVLPAGLTPSTAGLVPCI
jgi:hypothetical protein